MDVILIYILPIMTWERDLFFLIAIILKKSFFWIEVVL